MRLTNAHSSLIHNSQNLGKIQTPINRGMERQIWYGHEMEHIYRKEQTTDTHEKHEQILKTRWAKEARQQKNT